MKEYFHRLITKINTEKLSFGNKFSISWAIIWLVGLVTTGVFMYFFWSTGMLTLFGLTLGIPSSIHGLYYIFGKYPTVRGRLLTEKREKLVYGFFFILLVPFVIFISWLRLL